MSSLEFTVYMGEMSTELSTATAYKGELRGLSMCCEDGGYQDSWFLMVLSRDGTEVVPFEVDPASFAAVTARRSAGDVWTLSLIRESADAVWSVVGPE